MKKTGLLLVGALLLSMHSVLAIDINVMNGAGGITSETGLMRNHDMQMINQRRFEFEKSREYQAEQRAKKQEAELKTKFQQYETNKNNMLNPQSNMEFLQNQDGSIIIRQNKPTSSAQ